MGSFGYADDIVLLAPTLYSLKQMMTLCDDFGKEYHVTFNPDKYQFIHIPSDNDSKIEGISHNGCCIKNVNKATHLGHAISVYNNDVELNDGINTFIVAVNGIINTFHNCDVYVKYKLFKSFCMCLYGSVLWSYDSKSMKKFYVEW